MHKHRCALPFHHMAVRPDGGIRPCCYFRPDAAPADLTIEHADPFNHPFMNDIREKMLRDEYIEGCSKCYKDEAASGRSMRLEMNNPRTDFGLPKERRGEEVKLTNLDWAFSNVCNNKCRMCGPELSTQWYSDAKKMEYGFEKRGILAKNSIIEDSDLSNLRFIKMLGGEPLMEQEKFIKMLKRCNLPELTILLVTNTTLTPNEELTDLLKQCKKVSITLSVDSYGKINDFLRKGSNWETVETNIRWFTNTFKGYPVTLSLHSVASIYNINLVHELVEYCVKNDMYYTYTVVDGPNWIMPRNLPDAVKPAVLEYLETQKTKFKDKTVFKLLAYEVKQSGDFGMFIRNDIKLNKIRNETWKELNPWLWDKIQPYIIPEIL